MACVFILLMVSFKEQRFFVLMNFNHFYLWAVFFISSLKTLLSSSQRVPPLFSFKNFIISDCTVSSMTHCKLIMVLLPGKSHGWRSLVGYSPWGRKELDTIE